MESTKCHKVFTRGDNLRRHMKIHDRPYESNVLSQSSNGEDKSRIYQNTTEGCEKNELCKQNGGDIVSAIGKLIVRIDQLIYTIECQNKKGD